MLNKEYKNRINKPVKFLIIVRIPDVCSEAIDSFDTLEQAQSHLKEVLAPDCLDPYYQDVLDQDGSFSIEDENGNGY